MEMETATEMEMETETDPIIYMSMNEPSTKRILVIAKKYVENFKDERGKDTASQAPVDIIFDFDTSKYMPNQYDTAVAFINKYDDTQVPYFGNEGMGPQLENGLKLEPPVISISGGRHRPKPSKKRSTRRRRSSKRKSRKVNNRRK